MIRKVIKKVFPAREKDHVVEAQALAMMKPVLDQFSVPVVMTSSSLQPSALLTIQNDLVLNNRRVIVETGSGVGTLYMAMVGKLFDIDLRIYSIEEDSEWIKVVETILIRESLDGFVEFIHAPVDPESSNKWYDLTEINSRMTQLTSKIDMLIIDGPKAYRKGYELSRIGAVAVLGEHLNDRCFIMVDDTNRKGERQQVSMWEEKLGVKFDSRYNTFSVATKGDKYNYFPI